MYVYLLDLHYEGTHIIIFVTVAFAFKKKLTNFAIGDFQFNDRYLLKKKLLS